jgi:hypothetical protein
MTDRETLTLSKRKRRRSDTLDEFIREKAEACKLPNWSSLTEEVKVPAELAVALMTSRPELVKLAKPRPLSEEECKAVFHLVGVLIESNAALSEHAQMVGQMIDIWSQHFKALASTGRNIEAFANFRSPLEDDNVDGA